MEYRQGRRRACRAGNVLVELSLTCARHRISLVMETMANKHAAARLARLRVAIGWSKQFVCDQVKCDHQNPIPLGKRRPRHTGGNPGMGRGMRRRYADIAGARLSHHPAGIGPAITGLMQRCVTRTRRLPRAEIVRLGARAGFPARSPARLAEPSRVSAPPEIAHAYLTARHQARAAKLASIRRRLRLGDGVRQIELWKISASARCEFATISTTALSPSPAPGWRTTLSP